VTLAGAREPGLVTASVSLSSHVEQEWQVGITFASEAWGLLDQYNNLEGYDLGIFPRQQMTGIDTQWSRPEPEKYPGRRKTRPRWPFR
jgi:hypothetical protein